MRRSRKVLAPIVATIALAAGAAAAQGQRGDGIAIELRAPERIVVQDRAEIVALVRTSAGLARPLLLTPSTEGSAVEIVRGRFTRADATPTADGALRFRIPFVARAAGTALVRVRADAFVCEDGRCRPVRVEATLTLQIQPAGR